MTSWPQPLKQTALLPGPVQESFQKVLHILQPLAGVSPARKSPSPGQDRRLGGRLWDHRNPPQPALPVTESCSAFMNGPASQTADWLSRRPQGPISNGRSLVSAWGRSSSATVNGGELLPQGGEKGEGFLYLYLILNSRTVPRCGTIMSAASLGCSSRQ